MFFVQEKLFFIFHSFFQTLVLGPVVVFFLLYFYLFPVPSKNIFGKNIYIYIYNIELVRHIILSIFCFEKNNVFPYLLFDLFLLYMRKN